MQQRRWIIPLALGAGLFLVFVIGCAPTGVGDPCEPEVTDVLGENETVVESGSLQCRTRVCMWYNKQSFCTIQCGNDDDCNADWNEEGPGRGDIPSARCEAEVQVGSPAVIGKYCVPKRARKSD